MTPQHIVMIARACTGPVLAGLAAAIGLIDCTPAAAAALTFGAALVLMQAAPRIRASDVLGALAAFVTLAEWARAAAFRDVDATRWLACLAVAGAIVLLLKVQHFRALARQDAYVPLRQIERRSSLLARTPSKAVRRAS